MKIERIVSMLFVGLAVFIATSSSSFGDQAIPPTKQLSTAVEKTDTAPDVKTDAVTTEGNPEIFADQTEFKFPTVLDGVQVVHNFVIQNKGDAELKIKKVKTG